MVACSLVLYRQQIVERCLWWRIGAGGTAQFLQVLRGNPPENGANFGQLRLFRFDQVAYEIAQRFVTQICRSLKRSVQKSSMVPIKSSLLTRQPSTQK